MWTAKIVLLVLVAVVVTSGCIEGEERIRVYSDGRRGNPYPYLKFEVDCSRLSSESQDDCQTFIGNMENKLYPEMKRVTGIDLRWCYDTIKYTIYPELDEHGGKAGAYFRHNGSTVDIAHLAEFSIDSPCKMHPHELQHAFDICISNPRLLEVMTRVGRLVTLNLCPEYREEYNLPSLVYRELRKEADLEIGDCLTAQANVIYHNTDEEFIYKFYERLLQKKLDEPKTGEDITEAIIYASNETDYYIEKYCLDGTKSST